MRSILIILALTVTLAAAFPQLVVSFGIRNPLDHNETYADGDNIDAFHHVEMYNLTVKHCRNYKLTSGAWYWDSGPPGPPEAVEPLNGIYIIPPDPGGYIEFYATAKCQHVLEGGGTMHGQDGFDIGLNIVAP